MDRTQKNILSVDVEDWFHILEVSSSPPVDRWSSLPSRVEHNFMALLDLFELGNAKATCFFLGWIAESHPRLVRETVRRGHEVACHGYAHQLIYTQTPEQFRDDIRRSKDTLEQIAGTPVRGYRAPGFSLMENTLWALDEVAAAGFSYDSSIFPATRGHGGIVGYEMAPHHILTSKGPIIEFPMSVASLMGRRLCFFGGGYFRFFPFFVIRKMTQVVNSQSRPVIFYVHPREIDPEQPRLPMPLKRRFKSYVNLSTTRRKLERLFREQQVTSFERWLAEYQTTVKQAFHDDSSSSQAAGAR